MTMKEEVHCFVYPMARATFKILRAALLLIMTILPAIALAQPPLSDNEGFDRDRSEKNNVYLDYALRSERWLRQQAVMTRAGKI